MYALERANDLQRAEQLRHALELQVQRRRQIVSDYGHWSGSVEFLQSEPGDARYQEYVDAEFLDLVHAHSVPHVDGYRFYRLDGSVFFESVVDHLTLEPKPAPDFDLVQLKRALSDEPGAIVSGFMDDGDDTLLIALTAITNDQMTLAPAGYLLTWQWVGEGYFRTITGDDTLGVVQAGRPSSAAAVRAAQASSDGILPRDESDVIHWLLDDYTGNPLLVVAQRMPERTFHTGAFTRADIVGIFATILVLLLFSGVISRHVISPLEELSRFVNSVAVEGDYSLRIAVERKDEVGVVARYLTRLLDLIEQQEKQLKEKNEELLNLAENDALTGVANRRVFDRVLQRDWLLAQRYQHPVSCILLDVDWFGDYNNHYGHQQGDEALQKIAAALSRHVTRATDTLCRYGGEEFAIVLVDTELAYVDELAQQLVQAVRDLAIPHAASGSGEELTISVGVATWLPGEGDIATHLVALADTALYEAKRGGRDRVVIDRHMASDQPWA